MQFEIKNRWTGKVQFTAKIKCAEDAPVSVKIGLAVRWGYESDANLSGADLRGADLRGADLRGADLRDADLSGADLRDAVLSDAVLRDANLSGADLRDAVLRGANLRGADLRGAVLLSFKTDLWAILTENRKEVPGLVQAIKAGRVDGSTYSGECACLVGTIANVSGKPLDAFYKNSNRPAEQWFLMIGKGEKPTDDTGGGFASKKALEWIEEWAAFSGVDLEPVNV